MLAPITNNRIAPAYHAANFAFKSNYKAPVTKIADSGKNIAKEASNKKPVALLFAAALSGIAGWFNKKIEYDNETGKILRLNEYKDGQLSKVKHFSGRLFRWESIDEYKDGKIAKTTHFYKGTKTPDWDILYKEGGNNVISEYFANGWIKSRQFDTNDTKDYKFVYDNFERGKTIKKIKYNPDETIAYAYIYEDDNTTLEAYENGVLKYIDVIFHEERLPQRRIFYDKNKEVTAIEEVGVGYKTNYTYQNGRKAKSVTIYSNDEKISRKETEYKRDGSPVLETFYGHDNTLSEKREYLDNDTRILTRYNSKGKAIYSETLDLKTNKTTRKYSKR